VKSIYGHTLCSDTLHKDLHTYIYAICLYNDGRLHTLRTISGPRNKWYCKHPALCETSTENKGHFYLY